MISKKGKATHLLSCHFQTPSLFKLYATKKVIKVSFYVWTIEILRSILCTSSFITVLTNFQVVGLLHPLFQVVGFCIRYNQSPSHKTPHNEKETY